MSQRYDVSIWCHKIQLVRLVALYFEISNDMDEHITELIHNGFMDDYITLCALSGAAGGRCGRYAAG